MPHIESYDEKEFPEHLKWQALSFIRTVWPDGFEGQNQYRDWITRLGKYPFHRHVVVVEGKLLISHAEACYWELEHGGDTFKAASLTGVFTFPSFRGQGYGLQVVREARRIVEELSPDLFLFTGIDGFYEKSGFVLNPRIKLLVGDSNGPVAVEDMPYVDFISRKAKDAQNTFESEPVFVGEFVDL